MSPAPNRLFHLRELDRPDYRRVADRLERLVRSDPITYLHPSKRWEYAWALDRAELAPGSRVLDAGCGASAFPVLLAREGHRVIALDRELPERRPDRYHGVEIEYVEGDLTALPFDEGGFDAVFCISVIEHLPREGHPAAMQELRRVLRPGGPLLLTTDFYRDASARLRYRGPDRSFPVTWHVFDEDRLRSDLMGAPGLRLRGDLDLSVDWPATEPRMVEFHGYPYTSVGVAFIRE